MYSVVFLLLSILLFIVLGHVLAKRKGLNPVFWGVMGGMFGPFMLPFIILAKPHNPSSEPK